MDALLLVMILGVDGGKDSGRGSEGKLPLGQIGAHGRGPGQHGCASYPNEASVQIIRLFFSVGPPSYGSWPRNARATDGCLPTERVPPPPNRRPGGDYGVVAEEWALLRAEWARVGNAQRDVTDRWDAIAARGTPPPRGGGWGARGHGAHSCGEGGRAAGGVIEVPTPVSFCVLVFVESAFGR